jgi:uncharacterized SAM-binding protein YcdF (DUF218 family)
VLLVLIALYFMRAILLSGLAAFLVTEDPLQKADLIYLDNGSVDTAPFLATTLWRQGLAPVVVLAPTKMTETERMGLQPNVAEVARGVLEETGIPPEFIVTLPDPVSGLRDQILALTHYLDENDIESVIFVSSMFRTRRVRWMTRSEIDREQIRIQLAAASSPDFGTGDWWKSEQGFVAVLGEYLRLLHYIVFQ